MPKPACVKCGLFMRPEKNGVMVIEGMPVHDRDSGEWTPYKVWQADLWKCRRCGTELLTGWSGSPWSEHYKPDFQHFVEAATYTINDC